MDTTELRRLQEQVAGCTRCGLCTTRVCPVRDCIPDGRVRILLVGEAPGGHEATVSGRPFSGEAGRILETLLAAAGLRRHQVYVTNLVKCRPVRASERPRYGDHANRRPRAGEIAACAGFLREELRILQPELVVTLGALPLAWFRGRPAAMQELHGRRFLHGETGLPVFPLYHPASILYKRELRQECDRDMERLRGELGKKGDVGYGHLCDL